MSVDYEELSFTDTGFIIDVTTDVLGDELTVDAAAGATVLQLEDTVDFVDVISRVKIGTEIIELLSVDDELSTITLATPLVNSYLTGERVEVYPRTEETFAYVVTDEDVDAIAVSVPHHLVPMLVDGVRREDQYETVTIRLSGTEWVLDGIDGKIPLVDGGYLDPVTVPGTQPDGLPPESSPAPTVIEGIGILHVRWNAIDNNELVTYEVHISTTDGFMPTRGDAATLVTKTNGSSTSIRTLPGGGELQYGVTYYVRIIAYDVEVETVGAAAVSNQASGQLKQVTGPDISSNYVYAREISVNQLTGGTLSSDLILSSAIKTAVAGSRVEISPLGITVYSSASTPQIVLPTDPNAEASFKGIVEAAGLTVTGGATLESTKNKITKGGSLTLERGVSGSTNAPSHVIDWESLALAKTDATGRTIVPGNFKSATWVGGKILIPEYDAATRIIRYHLFNADGTYSSSRGTVTLPSGDAFHGATQMTDGGTAYEITASGTTYKLGTVPGTTVLPAPYIDDEFTGTLANWTTSGAVSIVSGKARVSNFGWMRSNQTFDMTSTEVTLDGADTAFGSGRVRVDLGARNGTDYLEIYSRGDYVDFRKKKDGNETLISSVSIANHAGTWKISEYNGTITMRVGAGSSVTTPNNFTAAEMSTAAVFIDSFDSGYVQVDRVRAQSTSSGPLPVTLTRVNTSQPPMIGNDGTNILIAEYDSANTRFVIKTHSTTNFAVTATVNTASSSTFGGPLATVMSGNFDLGAARFVIARRGTGTVDYRVFDSAGVRQTNEEFPPPTGGVYGSFYDGTQFWTLGNDGRLYKHTGIKWTTESSLWWAGYTWVRLDAGAVTYESPLSVKTSFTMKKRARFTLTAATIPYTGADSDPNAVGFYLARNATEPAATATVHQITPAPAAGQSVGANSVVRTTAVFTGNPPSTTKAFPNSTPALLRSDDDELVISADGSLKARTLEGTFTSGSVGTGTFRNSVDERIAALAPPPGTTIRLTPTMTVSSHNFYIKQIAPGVVAVSGYLDVDDTVTTRRDTGMRIPAGMWPLFQVIVSSPIVGGTSNYRYFFGTDGIIEFEQDATAGPFEGVSAVWFTN